MPRLPFDAVDVLLIDRIGKNISGVGFDPNVVGRKFNDHQAVEGETPKVKRICLRGLTPESHGNAIGLGMAEFCRTQLLRDMDPRITRLNALDQRPHRGRHDAAGLRNRPRDARRRPWGRSGWSNRRTPGCSGSPTRSTWPRWNVRPPIWKRPAGGAIWRSSREPREMEFDAEGNLGKSE